MLQIKNIKKTYTTGTLVQKALDDVSLNLRDNEFVAILGPSGSGKTTLLNIIGGLDQYDDGDLVINGISTKKYKDRDWDSYRNHTIGFVFQSYNLIPHQTLLSNVELALTISGISKSERRKRAQEALERVGLGAQVNKKPNQLSGGQMQRVAIARALVNDPDILLADEPTGALDSATSVQVMDLLQEVAKDRLVVMVTHNPELAEQYATRIVTLKDGHILSDTDPYVVDQAAIAPPVTKNMGKSSMSFLTALSLSFNNLGTKKARTLLTAFAGSIGIIGIALILALSNGVNGYIQETEEETLSEYPFQITSTGMDLSSLMSSNAGSVGTTTTEDEESSVINVIQTMTSMFSSMDENDLTSLKEYIESGESDIYDYTTAIEYIYDIKPQIYRVLDDSYRQVNPDQTLSNMGMSLSSSLFSSVMSTDSFYSLPSSEQMYIDQYDVMAGHWPENRNELVLVLTSSGSISDFTMYTLGLRDAVELDDMIASFQNGENADVPDDMGTYTYDDILGTTFKLVNAADCYEYDEEYDLWKDKTDDTAYMNSLVANGEDLTIVGIVQPKEDATSMALSAGINYTPELTTYISEYAENSQIVQDQLANRDKNVFTGEKFGEDNDSMTMDSLFTVDEDAFANMFDTSGLDLSSLDADSLDFSSIDMSSLDFSKLDMSSIDLSNMDFSNLDWSSLDLSSVDLSNIEVEQPDIDMQDILSSVKITGTEEDMQKLTQELMADYAKYLAEHPEESPINTSVTFQDYLKSDAAKTILKNDITQIVKDSATVTVSTDAVKNLAVGILTNYQAWATDNNIDLSQETDQLSHLNDYLATESAKTYLQTWIDSNVTISDDITITDDQINTVSNDLATGYVTYLAQSAGSGSGSGSTSDSFTNYLQTESAQKIITDGLSTMIDTSAVEAKVQAALSEYVQNAISAYSTAIMQQMQTQITKLVTQMVSQMMEEIMKQLSTQLTQIITEAMTDIMTQAMEQMATAISDALSDALKIDTSALENAFHFNMDADELRELMLSMSSSGSASYDSNLTNLGYADFDSPSEIDIYPTDFNAKDNVIQILDDYNDRMKAEGLDDKVITYTDMVGTLMTSVTRIVDMISYVLIAFVGISLVVSSIMIGVITYISVLERQKEIGILRAIGASKRNVSQIFNAETFIIGLIAGLLGVGLAALLTFPVNAVIRAVSGVTTLHARLPITPAIILVLLSIGLTMLGGLLPAKKASKSDPVTALRTD